MNLESTRDQIFRRRLEAAKFWVEYLKHLTMLSTGSILLVVTFLERLFSRPLWKWAVIVAILALLLAVIGSVSAFTVMTLNIENWDEGDDPSELRWDRFGRAALYITWGGFFSRNVFTCFFCHQESSVMSN